MPTRCRFAPTRPARISLRAEPFRLFFPIAIVASMVGVALWPMVYGGWLGFFPGEAHARVMIQGFVGGFAMGFVTTAFPKMVGSPSFTWPELGIMIGLLVSCVAAHAVNSTIAGDSLFLTAWVLLLVCLGTRLCFFREDLPPPGFVLVGLGFAAGTVGVTLLLVGRIIVLTDFQRGLAHLLLYEAFLLGPVLGVGGFLFPRFFNDGRIDRGGSWGDRARVSWLVGLALLVTYVVEAHGFKVWPPMVRAGLAATYLLSRVRVFRRGGSTGSLSMMLRAAVFCALGGIMVSDVFIAAEKAVKHVLLIGGFGLLALTVASRVTWGHSGNIEFATGKRRSLQIVLWAVVVAMLTRVVAGFVPAIRVSHHIYAALLWIIAAAVWSWAVLRFVRRADPDGRPQ